MSQVAAKMDEPDNALVGVVEEDVRHVVGRGLRGWGGEEDRRGGGASEEGGYREGRRCCGA